MLLLERIESSKVLTYSVSFTDIYAFDFKRTQRLSPGYKALGRGLRMIKKGPCSQELIDQSKRRENKRERLEMQFVKA